MIKLSGLSTVKNLTRLALGGTLGATLIITASKPSEAAILGWDIRRDDPYGFDGSFYFDNVYSPHPAGYFEYFLFNLTQS